MPVPSAITDLSTTAASNSPAGSDNVFPDLDNYLRAQASFVAQLYARRLAINIAEYPYNADGTSVANQTATLQSAIDACSAAGGGDVFIPNGTFLVQNLAMKTGVRLVGQSKAAILKLFSLTGTNTMITITTVSNVGFSNLTIDLANGTGTDALGVMAIQVTSTGVAGANNVFIDNVAFTNSGSIVASTATRPFISVQPSFTSRNYRITNCTFTGRNAMRFLPNYVPSAAPTDTGCGNWIITNNVARDAEVFLQIRSGGTQAFDQFDSVVVSGNQVYAVPNDPTGDSSSPMEVFCVTGLTVSGNTIYTGARGYNATLCKAAVYDANIAYDQTRYFMELQRCDGITISNNTAYNCKTFVNETAQAVSDGSKNIQIIGNTIAGGNSGEAGYDEFAFVNCITMQSNSTYSNWRVADNTFVGLKYTLAVVRIDGTLDGYVCENNVFVESDATQQLTAVQCAAGSNIIVRNNVITRTVNITDASYGVARTGSCVNGSAVVTGIASGQSTITNQTSALSAGMVVTGSGIPAGTTISTVDSSTQVTLSAAYTGVTGTVALTFIPNFVDSFIYLTPSSTGSNLIIEDNVIRWTGSDARTGAANTGAVGIGANAGASSSLTKVIVRNNKITGNFSGSTGSAFAAVRLPLSAGDTVYMNNDLTGVTAGGESLNAAIVYRRTTREFESTAAPTAGTYLVGDRAWNSAPAAGQPKSWVCTVAGTPGTWVSEGNL